MLASNTIDTRVRELSIQRTRTFSRDTNRSHNLFLLSEET